MHATSMTQTRHHHPGWCVTTLVHSPPPPSLTPLPQTPEILNQRLLISPAPRKSEEPSTGSKVTVGKQVKLTGRDDDDVVVFFCFLFRKSSRELWWRLCSKGPCATPWCVCVSTVDHRRSHWILVKRFILASIVWCLHFIIHQKRY